MPTSLVCGAYHLSCVCDTISNRPFISRMSASGYGEIPHNSVDQTFVSQMFKDPPWYAYIDRPIHRRGGFMLPVKGYVIINARKEQCCQISLLPRKTGATCRLLTRRCIHYLIGLLHLMSFFCWILVTRFLYIPRPTEVTPLRWAWLTISTSYTNLIAPMYIIIIRVHFLFP